MAPLLNFLVGGISFFLYPNILRINKLINDNASYPKVYECLKKEYV